MSDNFYSMELMAREKARWAEAEMKRRQMLVRARITAPRTFLLQSLGEVLIRAGLPARTLYILKQGDLMVSFPDGRAITMHKPGGVVGWSALVSPTRYTASVTCLTDCTLISFSGRELLRLVQRNVAAGTKIMRKISEVLSRRLPFLQEEDKRRIKSRR